MPASACAYGAAVVVMAFDEVGQADTKERKIEICERAYKLLVGDRLPARGHHLRSQRLRRGHAASRSIDNYAIDFIEATREIRSRCPRRPHLGRPLEPAASRFRGNEPVRRAMHSRVPLPRHPRGHGHGASSTPASSTSTTRSSPSCARPCEDVILNQDREDATERLIALAERFAGTDAAAEKQAAEWRGLAHVAKRLQHALVKGIDALSSSRIPRKPASSARARSR